MLSNSEVVVKNPSDFMGAHIGGSEERTNAILAGAAGKVLVVDEAYGLYGGSRERQDQFKKAVIDTICATVHSTPGDDRCVKLLGYRDQMEEMLQNVNPGLSRRFPVSSAFDFADFTQDQLSTIADRKVHQEGFEVTRSAKEVMMEMLGRARNRPSFGNAGEVDVLLNDAKVRYQERLSAGKVEHMDVLEPGDFDPDFDRLKRSETNTMELFQGSIGYEKIVAKLQGYQETVRQMKRLDIKLDKIREVIPFHFVFRGPPGTGKTTTARRMGQIFYDAGFLTDASVVECSTSELVGKYIGHTGPKLRKMLDKAAGRVLFIDEAYRLAEGRFTQEALDELVDACTKERYYKRLVIILAGYEDDMDKLLKANPGLESRFSESFDFRALRPQECIDLLIRKLVDGQKMLEEPGLGTLSLRCMQPPSEHLQHRLTVCFRQLKGFKSWANARDIETIAHRLVDKTLKLRVDDDADLVLSQLVIIETMEGMIAEKKSLVKIADVLLGLDV